MNSYSKVTMVLAGWLDARGGRSDQLLNTIAALLYFEAAHPSN